MGRTLTKEEIWTALEMPRSTYYDQLDKGTLISADNLSKAGANLGITRADLLTRSGFTAPDAVASLAKGIGGRAAAPSPSATVVTAPPKPEFSESRPRLDAPPL